MPSSLLKDMHRNERAGCRLLVVCLLLALGTAGCLLEEDPPAPEEEACCECLVNAGCTTVSYETCMEELFEREGSIPVNTTCLAFQPCQINCIEAGVSVE